MFRKGDFDFYLIPDDIICISIYCDKFFDVLYERFSGEDFKKRFPELSFFAGKEELYFMKVSVENRNDFYSMRLERKDAKDYLFNVLCQCQRIVDNN